MRSDRMSAALGWCRFCSWSMLYVVNPASRIAADRLPDPAKNPINTVLTSVKPCTVDGQELPTWEHS